MGKTILFFYGSLRRGESNHHRVAGQTFLRNAQTAPRYRLLNLGQYTGMVCDDIQGTSIPGELWEVDEMCLAELDAFEGPDYPRRPVDIEGATGVQSYLWRDSC